MRNWPADGDRSVPTSAHSAHARAESERIRNTPGTKLHHFHGVANRRTPVARRWFLALSFARPLNDCIAPNLARIETSNRHLMIAPAHPFVVQKKDGAVYTTGDCRS